MGQISILEGKTLKLRNVMSLSMTSDEFNQGSVDNKVRIFRNRILNKGGKLKGPLINHNKHKNGERIVTFHQQIETKIGTVTPFSFSNEIIIDECLFTRFTGKDFDVDLAYQKTNVYAYENGLHLSDENYCVFLQGEGNTDGEIKVDIFSPLK